MLQIPSPTPRGHLPSLRLCVWCFLLLIYFSCCCFFWLPPYLLIPYWPFRCKTLLHSVTSDVVIPPLTAKLPNVLFKKKNKNTGQEYIWLSTIAHTCSLQHIYSFSMKTFIFTHYDPLAQRKKGNRCRCRRIKKNMVTWIAVALSIFTMKLKLYTSTSCRIFTNHDCLGIPVSHSVVIFDIAKVICS